MCERGKDDFTTVYRKTYTRKYAFRPDPILHEQDYKDVLAGPFTEYVLPNTHVIPEHPYEHIRDNYNRLVGNNPKVKRHLDKEPDESVVAADQANKGRSVYQVDYCNIEDGFESAKTRARRHVNLPSDWGEIPRTTQRASYRVPTKIATFNLRVLPAHPPKSKLQPNLKEREILRVTTGQTEYEGKIGALGDLIMEDQLHGEHMDNVQCLRYQLMLQEQSPSVPST